MSSSPTVLAGPGLLRSGNTLSVNPNLKLRTLDVRDSITVPDPINSSEACSKQYVDNAISARGIAAGDNIQTKAGSSTSMTTVSLVPDLHVNSIKLTGTIGEDATYVPNKGYVDNAVANLATKDSVAVATDGVLKSKDLQDAIEPLATRRYVSTYMDRFVENDKFSSTLEDYAKKQYVDDAIYDFATIDYVNDKAKTALSQIDLSTTLAPYATTEYVDSKTSDIVTRDDFVVSQNTLQEGILSEAKTFINDATESLASTEYVDNATSALASKDFVTSTMTNVATKNFVEELVSPLAEESYVDEQIVGLASESYVDDAVENMADTVNKYVDKVFYGKAVKQTIQYETPADSDTIVSDESSFILLNPEGNLENLTIKLSLDVSDGTVLTVSSSKDVTNLTFSNATLLPETDGLGLVAGQSLKYIYSSSAGAWFSV